jgi:hypothetical protein
METRMQTMRAHAAPAMLLLLLTTALVALPVEGVHRALSVSVKAKWNGGGAR